MIARPVPIPAGSSTTHSDNHRNHHTVDAAQLARQRNTDRKREWRRNRSEHQQFLARKRDAERKCAKRKAMTPEQRAIEREKDAERKVRKRRKEKEDKNRAKAMSVTRILND